jgi:hypothetical protein
MNTDYIKLLEEKRLELETYQDEICYKKLKEVFDYWAFNFPDYDLTVIHGMGIYSFDTNMPLSASIEDLISDERQSNIFWEDEYETLFMPLREYTELFDSVCIGPPPCPCDMKYCSKTNKVTIN